MVTDSRPRPDVDDVSCILMEATAETARNLAASGNFTEARAEGSVLLATAGKHSFAVRNRVSKGPPGNREKMLALYASMVVRNLVGRVQQTGEGGG